MVYTARRPKIIYTKADGARIPGRYAHDAILHKILLYEVARLTCTPLVTFDNDAKLCYDRIVMTFALMLCQPEAWRSTVHVHDGSHGSSACGACD